tara:strand:- start:299 stop:1099 length:801 start_codon:yes stop_codon:yes gene_type:complete
MNYMKFNDGGNIEAMMAAMSGQQGGQGGQGDLRTIDGQSTSEVQEDEEGRQFVMYETPEGDTVKVFGDWESYGEIMAPGGGGVAPGDQRFIADREFPVMANRETGEYELDVDAMETEMYSEPEREMAEQAAPGGPGASGMEALMESLTDAKGPQGQRGQGGMVEYDNGGRLSREERKFKRGVRKAYRNNDTEGVLGALGSYKGSPEKKQLTRGGVAGIFGGAAGGIGVLGNAAAKAAKRLNDSGRYGMGENPSPKDIIREMLRGNQ